MAQNGTIKLQAKVIGNPVPEIMWLYNNNPLMSTDRVKLSYDGENIELIIKKADSEKDSGDYKCIASNIVGKASHGAKVSVDVDKVKFTRELKKSFTIEETQLLTLECETSHTVSTKWLFNNQEISGMDHRIIVHEGRNHKLIIKNTGIRDTGKYKCTVKDQKTETDVEVLERKPEFTRLLEDIEVKENEKAIFEVEITSNSADVTWLKDGVDVDTSNPQFVFEKENNIRRFIIKEATVYDEGDYTCALPDQDCSAELIIIELPPKIITTMKDLTVTKGEKAMFVIELTKGDAWVRWFKDQKELQFSDHVQLSIDGKKHKLKIYKSELNDAGTYSCEVGEDKSSANLTVEEPLVDFIKRLADVTLVIKNNEATFTVELSQPDAELKWFKNGKELKPSDKYIINVEGTVRQLIIKSAQIEDEDIYYCTTGNVKSSSQLKVEGNL